MLIPHVCRIRRQISFLIKYIANVSVPGDRRPYNAVLRASYFMGSASGAEPQIGSASGAQPQIGSASGAQPQIGSASGAQPQIGSASGAQPRFAFVIKLRDAQAIHFHAVLVAEYVRTLATVAGASTRDAERPGVRSHAERGNEGFMLFAVRFADVGRAPRRWRGTPCGHGPIAIRRLSPTDSRCPPSRARISRGRTSPRETRVIFLRFLGKKGISENRDPGRCADRRVEAKKNERLSAARRLGAWSLAASARNHDCVVAVKFDPHEMPQGVHKFDEVATDDDPARRAFRQGEPHGGRLA
jgi:hypothetical protein